MPLLTVYSDLHYGAPHSTKTRITDIINEHSKGYVVLTGDIFDIKNTKRSELPHYQAQKRRLKERLRADYIEGNHECEVPERYYLVKKIGDKRILFCHGHTLRWSEKKVKKWEQKKPGKSNFKYFLYRFKHLVVKRGKKLKPSQVLLDKCYELCENYNCDTIVFGHTHKHCDIQYKGKRIINVQRGKTEIII